MKNLFSGLLCVAGIFSSTSAYAKDQTTDIYCGKPKFEVETSSGLPEKRVTGISVTESTNANVQKVIKKFGAHNIEFTYEDAPKMHSFTASVIQVLTDNPGLKTVCVEGMATYLSRWGTPIEILPEYVSSPIKAYN